MKFKQSLFLLAFLFSAHVFSQKKITITGTVTDSINRPVVDAVIFLDDYKTNERTNSKGFYKIKVKELPASVSAFLEGLGFETSECCDRNIANIKFGKNSLKNGEYVKFLTLYESKKREVKTEQYFTDIYAYLKAKVPMLRISGTNQVRVQGYDISFNGSSEPLFILNGSPISNIADINPNDIKNVTVLKGASTASYGIRGANGVIIIQTK